MCSNKVVFASHDYTEAPTSVGESRQSLLIFACHADIALVQSQPRPFRHRYISGGKEDRLSPVSHAAVQTGCVSPMSAVKGLRGELDHVTVRFDGMQYICR